MIYVPDRQDDLPLSSRYTNGLMFPDLPFDHPPFSGEEARSACPVSQHAQCLALRYLLQIHLFEFG
jgi:hypothetical protein